MAEIGEAVHPHTGGDNIRLCMDTDTPLSLSSIHHPVITFILSEGSVELMGQLRAARRTQPPPVVGVSVPTVTPARRCVAAHRGPLVLGYWAITQSSKPGRRACPSGWADGKDVERRWRTLAASFPPVSINVLPIYISSVGLASPGQRLVQAAAH